MHEKSRFFSNAEREPALTTPALPDPTVFVPRLLAWFARSARALPWRENRDPYRIWLSEIMLQQTRVGTVISYFNRFVAELPSVESLAAADEEMLMRLWSGLGYYRRMRLLHTCAKRIVGEYGGLFPAETEELRKLPGIGAYTAGAISSIAFDRPAPAVDGNVLRVLSRLSAADGWTPAAAQRALVEVYPAGHCGEFTQSMMELGAIVCLPNGAPRCAECPLADLCRAFRLNRVGDFPRRREKNTRPVEELCVYLLRSGGAVAVRRRPAKGVLAGLWELPNEPAVSAGAPERFGSVTARREARHLFTHREWRMTVFEISAARRFAEFEWRNEADLVLPAAFRKLL